MLILLFHLRRQAQMRTTIYMGIFILHLIYVLVDNNFHNISFRPEKNI